jgi:hypothetical protein
MPSLARPRGCPEATSSQLEKGTFYASLKTIGKLAVVGIFPFAANAQGAKGEEVLILAKHLDKVEHPNQLQQVWKGRSQYSDRGDDRGGCNDVLRLPRLWHGCNQIHKRQYSKSK